ncbi:MULTISPECIES: hypothetical protein [Bacillus cereus group]|uniref:hypothetical protein n=1 Tax=Bacillus cereus group TaxID=86661 RepID=UPI0018CEAAD8|nr:MULTISPECIES: hypothetical protein [Bacillus cereus group]MED2900598.1 hypothetical protein [Bacillus tropicus]
MSKVGVCKVDITPPIGIDFVGYHRETGINNIEERIYGTVFVFEKDEMKTVFISIDNIGMLIEDTNMIRERVASRFHEPNELAFFGGYTNGYLGYLPTKEEFAYGGYEVELSPVVYGPVTNLLMPLEENTAELIVKKVTGLCNKVNL